MNQIPTKFEKSGNVLAPGIYFDLPEEIYHADHSLGSGSIRSLAKHPIYYWTDSWMNPLREEQRETEALLLGRALHKVVLEGLDAFHASYQPEPSKADFPLAFDTATQIKARLKELGQKQTGAKPELIERLKAADPEALIWEEIEKSFEADCAAKGITPLKRKMWQKVIAGAASIAADERVAPAFKNGVPEISVFAVLEGVPCKCRLDYLRFGREGGRTVGIITDLKSFTNMAELPPERAVAHAIANTGLHIQAAEYMRLAAMIPALIAEGRVFSPPKGSEEFLAQLAKLGEEDWRWFWCFYEKEAPVTLLRSPDKQVLEVGAADLDRALEAYREHLGRFGTDWRFVDPMPDTTITLQDLPGWVGRV